MQASGGIRSLADAQALLAAGAARIVVGTAALDAPDALAELAGAFDERLVVAVDARDGRVAVAGWSRMTELSPDEFAERCAEAGVRGCSARRSTATGRWPGPTSSCSGACATARACRCSRPAASARRRIVDALASLGLEGAVVGRALLEGRDQALDGLGQARGGELAHGRLREQQRRSATASKTSRSSSE